MVVLYVVMELQFHVPILIRTSLSPELLVLGMFLSILWICGGGCGFSISLSSSDDGYSIDEFVAELDLSGDHSIEECEELGFSPVSELDSSSSLSEGHSSVELAPVAFFSTGSWDSSHSFDEVDIFVSVVVINLIKKKMCWYL